MDLTNAERAVLIDLVTREWLGLAQRTLTPVGPSPEIMQARLDLLDRIRAKLS